MNTEDKKLSLFKLESLHRILLPTSLLISYSILNLNTAIDLLRNFWVRVNLGVDLTDESFNLMNLTNSESNLAWPYSRTLGPIFNFLNNDIAHFRLAGLVILSIICLLGIVISLAEANKVDKIKFFLLTSLIPLQIVIILFVPSVFWYLLVTPGYQWILITGSISLAILLIGLVPRYSELSIFMKITLIGISLILLAMSLARLSGGIIAVLSVSLALMWKRDFQSFKKFIVFLYSSILLTSGFFIAFNFELIKNYVITMNNFSKVLPQAFSLKSEVTDVLLPVIFLLCLIAFNKILLQFSFLRFSRVHITIFQYVYLFGILPLLAFSLSKTDVILNVTFPRNSLAILCLIAIFLSLNIGKSEILLIPLILLPFLTLFGSSTQAIGNWQTMLFCVYGLLIFCAGALRSNIEISPTRKIHLIVTLFIISASCSILANRIGSDTYQKDLLPRNAPVDKVTNLNYTAEKLESINFFRSQAFENGFTSGKSILDLSYWHPGLAFILNSSTEKNTIYDRFFQSSLNLQVNNLSSTLTKFRSEKGFILLPVEKSRIFTNSSCQNLTEYLDTDPLAKLLQNQGFNPRVRYISIYRSHKIDLTTPANDIILVKVC
jgi:hypothetical protein